MIQNLLILVAGLILLIKGADFFIKGASSIAQKFKIPQIIIGLTIVAMGTSAPEASVSISSALKGSAGVAIGNVLGSNIINILLILGLTSAICALKLQKATVKFEMPFLFFITLLLCAMGYFYHSINRIGALILLLLFVVFLIYLFKIAQSNQDEEVQQDKCENIFKMILFVVGGLCALVYGSNLTVDSAINIAKMLNVSERIIGLTIVAIGTSLPELVTCVIAALKKQPDIAIGNIVGSNIFNILFVLGVTCLITPVAFDSAFFFDAIIAIVSVILLYLFTCRDKYLTRIEGVGFLLFYGVYLYYLIR